MGVDTSTYRARIGRNYDRAAVAQKSLAFINENNLLQFLSLVCLRSPNSATTAIFIHFFLIPKKEFCKLLRASSQSSPHDFFVYKYISTRHFKELVMTRTLPVEENYSSVIIVSLYVFCTILLTLFALDYLLLCCGDIEPNPGPVSGFGDLCAVHINACSIRNKLDIIEAESNHFDIITVSETWLSESISNNSILLTNFHPPIRQDRPHDPHGGVAIYLRNNLSCKPRPDLKVANLEAVWVETKLKQDKLLVGSFYRPPNADVQYWNLINESIEKANNTNIKYIVLGDFNTNWLDRPSPHLLNLINIYGLKQLISDPTRITINSATCLDLILTQSEQMVARTEVLPNLCSDHSIPCVYLRQAKPKYTTFKRTLYNYKKLDNNRFRDLLSNVNWNYIFNNGSINESVASFTDTLLGIAKQCMPVKQVTVRTNDAPWITDEIKMLIFEKKRIHRIAKTTNTTENWAKFRRCRNDLTTLIRKTKTDYVETLDKKASDPKLFGQKDWWKLVKTFMTNKCIIFDEIPPIESNGIVYYSNKEKADIFNAHFISQSTLPDNDDPEPDVPTLDNQPVLDSIIISQDTVSKILKNLDSNKAVGPDLVHNRLLTAACDYISLPLANFFNKCLNDCAFPDPWKIANVTPIYKKGSKELCTNYRPISLLSCVGKVFESCVYKHVFGYLKENDILTSSQSGFIRGDSAINQLLCIYNDLCSSWDKGTNSQAVYLDITKAFDRVWHRGLLAKLSAVGIRGRLLLWFSDYLFNRQQATVIKGAKSDQAIIQAGVPQGSVLGPLLFLIYINDIVHDIQSTIKLFADDTSISLSVKNPQVRADTLNQDLVKIAEWGVRWKVKFNENKTELLNYTRGIDDSFPLVLGSTQLDDVTHHKHLGITLQNNFKWDFHIKALIDKITTLISCLKSYKYRFSRKTLETLYKSYVLPILDYGDIIWDNCTDSLANSLEDLHLDALRTITGSVRGTSHQKLYQESGFCSLKERRQRHKIMFYKKISLGFYPDYLTNLLPPLVSSYNPYHRRRPLERQTPLCKTELYRNSFFPSTTKLYNELPLLLQQSTSLGELKRFLKSSDSNVPPYYYYGNRTDQIIHCRLRLKMSDLNNDLFNRHLIEHHSCSCGNPCETAEHYLLQCNNYLDIRNRTIHRLPENFINISTLLFGNSILQKDDNFVIFAAVHEFIQQSQRFNLAL
jgi:hypothetical protein